MQRWTVTLCVDNLVLTFKKIPTENHWLYQTTQVSEIYSNTSFFGISRKLQEKLFFSGIKISYPSKHPQITFSKSAPSNLCRLHNRLS